MKLNTERTAWLIEQLALKESTVKIKETYPRMFEDTITGEELMQFRSDRKKAISDAAKELLNDIQAEPLAHARTRLRICNDMLQDAMAPRPVSSVPIRAEGKSIEYEVRYEPNHTAAAKWVQLGQNEEFFIKKLILELRKADVPREDAAEISSTGFEVIQVNDGLKRLDAK